MIELHFQKPWQHQKEVLYSKQDRKLMVTGRRTGKTLAAVEYIILQALQHQGQYWWVAPDSYQSLVAERFMTNILSPLDCYSKGYRRFTLPNSSQITLKTARADANLRGEGLSGCVVDEAAFMHESVWYECLMPSLRDKKGWALLCTTPNGYNWVHDLYENIRGSKDWFFLECPSWASPLISKEELEKDRVTMGDNRWNQEYGGKFTAVGSALFKRDYFDNIFVDRLPEALLTNGVHRRFQRSAIAVDLSMGHLESDFQAIVALGWRDGEFYAECLMERMPIPELFIRLTELQSRWQAEGIFFESNGFQAVEIQRYRAVLGASAPPIFSIPNSENKEIRISRLGDILSRKVVHVLNTRGGQELVRQLRDFPGAEHDDGPDALEMAWRSIYSTNR